jgi:hypothetical protein
MLKPFSKVIGYQKKPANNNLLLVLKKHICHCLYTCQAAITRRHGQSSSTLDHTQNLRNINFITLSSLPKPSKTKPSFHAPFSSILRSKNNGCKIGESLGDGSQGWQEAQWEVKIKKLLECFFFASIESIDHLCIFFCASIPHYFKHV